MNIHPNPSNGLCYINLAASTRDAKRILVVDIRGKVVYNKEVSQRQLEGSKMEVDLTYLPKGVYVVSLLSEDAIRSSQIVLQ